MGFDFSEIDAPDSHQTTSDSLERHYNRGILRLHEICDAYHDEDYPDGRQYLTDKGYYIADNFYMVNPFSYIGLPRSKSGYFRNGYIFIILGPGNLEDMFSTLVNSKKLQSAHIRNITFDKNIATKIPWVIFQRHHGPIEVGDVTFPDESFGCKNDTIVFRGIFRAAVNATDNQKYKLDRVWDRFYFDPVADIDLN